LFPYPDSGCIDQVIVDEAGQIPPHQVFPVLVRCNRALIVGDPLQLEPVVNLSDQKKDEYRSKSFLEQGLTDVDYDRYSPTATTAYHRAAGASGQIQDIGQGIILKYHYRCVPVIADFCDRLCNYGMVIKTEPKASRYAKIRKQRKDSAVKEVSSLPQKPLPKRQSENTSFWGKIAASLNPFKKVDKYQACMDAHDFFEENQVLVGATAWEGYQQQGKGLVLVQGSDSSATKIEYIPRKFLKKSMRQHDVAPQDTQAMDNMISVYEPTNSVVMDYINTVGEMSISMSPQNDPTPEDCYRMSQQTT
jgi:hypothetical protein